jgi:hypothetical protein
MTVAALDRHRGPYLGPLASIFTVLFLAGLYEVTVFNGTPFFPGPWESAQTMAAYFQQRPAAAQMCAFFHFGAATVLGIFTATIVSQLRFLRVRAAGTFIALFGGLATALNMMGSAAVLWAMAHPGIAQEPALVSGLYFIQFALGGPGFSVPIGLLMAGVSVPAMIYKLLPRWLGVLGIALAAAGELSWFNLIAPQALFLVPLTRFPGMVWMIAAGFLLPRTRGRRAREQPN